jgi:hypothetical protein
MAAIRSALALLGRRSCGPSGSAAVASLGGTRIEMQQVFRPAAPPLSSLLPARHSVEVRKHLSYGPPWAHYLGGYQDRLLGGPLGLPGLRYAAPEGV